MLFRHFIIAGLTYYYIITATGAALNGFTVKNIEDSAISAKKYFIIKGATFMFKKKFIIVNNKKKYY